MSIDQFNDDPPPVDDGGDAVIEIQKQSITTIQEITELRASAQESNEEELHRRNASAGTERLSEKVRRTRLLSRSTDGKGPVASVQDGAERSLRVQSKDSMFGMMWKKQNKYGSGIAAIGQTYTIPPSDATFMYVKTKHTKPKIVVTFDKAELRKKVDRITFNEARRLLESVYETIVAELFEEGAACWAHHFEQIFLKEKELFNEKAVRYTLNTERPFLYEIIDRIKKSHEAALKENGTKVSFKYLYDLMVFVEPYGNMFDWFITDLYEVIARMCKDAENLDTGAYEVIARIYFKYAVYRDVNMRDTSGAIKWTEKALELAKGELWTAEIGIWGVTLHELIAPTYAEMLIQKADEIMFQDYDLALSLSRKAILAVCEVDKDKFKVHFCRAQMFTAKLLIENDEYQNAKQLLQQMKDKILNADTLELKKMSTEFYYREGTCIMHLSSMPEEKALQIFEKGLKTSRLYGQKDFEALILLNLGKLYAKTFKKSEGAPICYREALTIFFELGDIENIKRTKYLLAEISSNFIFPHLMDLLKTSGEKYCNYYKLRMWKNQCRPFWLMTQEDLMDKVDPIYCLLKRNA